MLKYLLPLLALCATVVGNETVPIRFEKNAVVFMQRGKMAILYDGHLYLIREYVDLGECLNCD